MGVATAAVIGGAVVGGMAGSQKDRSSQRTSSGIDIAAAGEREKNAFSDADEFFSQLKDLVGAGPGKDAQTTANASNQSLAELLKQFAQGGFTPNQQDFQKAGQLTNNIFAPQQTNLNQQFQDAQQMAARQAGIAGRAPNDPILLNKLLQEQTRQQQTLDSQKTSFLAQQAQNMPMQRLGFTSQLADLNNSLASQAFANRQALLGLGSQIGEGERSFRLGTASRWSEQSTSGGGGIKGMLTGALGGASSMMGMGGLMGGGGSPGGGGMAMGGPMGMMGKFSTTA